MTEKPEGLSEEQPMTQTTDKSAGDLARKIAEAVVQKGGILGDAEARRIAVRSHGRNERSGR